LRSARKRSKPPEPKPPGVMLRRLFCFWKFVFREPRHMTAQLIDGTALSKKLRAEIAQKAAVLTAAGNQPGLAVLLVGDDPASQVYVRNKHKACEDALFYSRVIRLDADTPEAALIEQIHSLNADASIHGILLQLPLPKHLDANRVIAHISPLKDVDGLHIASSGALVQGTVGFKSCTPYGCMKMLESIGMTDLRGKTAVVIGRSILVGKPMALLLLNANATVTICHSGTTNLAQVCRTADILVPAIGRAKFVTADMVKPGAVVLDVGINRNADGKLVGDADFAAVSSVAGFITPVPGGVGPMTITMLLQNTIEAVERSL
jgi:methylenetetrahydrofolate dehydrogenase (NADP+) / methenyltetrahydrofolate cyclohydrolase